MITSKSGRLQATFPRRTDLLPICTRRPSGPAPTAETAAAAPRRPPAGTGTAARLLWAAALLAFAPPLGAQRVDLRAEATAGSEAEGYLRALQVAGAVPLYPWSIRAFSPRELAAMAPDSAHPWAARLPASGARARLLRPRAALGWNSAFPAQRNDGPVWAGRGVTAAGSAGLSLRGGAVSLRVEPLAFWTENRAFALMPNGHDGELRFADADRPVNIDQPQRFGEDAYARLDPGESTLRLDAGGVAAGVSTAGQQWGPAAELPLVLGTHGGGFPHAFLGTSGPLRVGIGRLHGRVVWGMLEQSDYSVISGSGSRRYMSGVVATFLPWGVDGLEVGVTRFFHTAWPEGGLRARDLLQPLQAFLKASLDSTGLGADDRWSPDNQLASVYARWVFPRSGAEIWGEYVRNDHNWDLLDFILEPDHASGYLLGARKVWLRPGRMLSLSGEWVESQQSHLATVRRQGTLYTHTIQRQGHTHRGQLLGSPAAYGGGGGVLALEAYTPGGRWRVDLARTRLRGGGAEGDSTAVDVVQSLGGEVSVFRGRLDWTAHARASYEVNRHYAGDAWNLSAGLAVRLGL